MIPSESVSHPFPQVPIPAELLAVADGPIELVWLNDAGGYTARVDGVVGLGAGSYYVKWNPRDTGLSLATEAKRMEWLTTTDHPTARVVDFRDSAQGELLISEDLGATSAVFPEWVRQPDIALRAIAEGLRRLHRLPPDGCPFSWSAESRLDSITNEETRERLSDVPPIDRLVVCHGDACAPNTLVNRDGSFAATIDLENLGVADRWADLAVTIMSLDWNYPQYDQKVFWETYGVEPDLERMAYYRALWDAE